MNSRLPLIDVIIITKYLCEDIKEEDYEMIHIPIEMKVNGEVKENIIVGVCKEKEHKDILKKLLENKGKNKEDVVLPDGFCHITTFDSSINNRVITFDSEDDCPIKVDFNKEFKSLEYFFKKFINFRDNLVKNKQVVKSDDIYQYYDSLAGFQRSRKNKRR